MAFVPKEEDEKKAGTMGVLSPDAAPGAQSVGAPQGIQIAGQAAQVGGGQTAPDIAQRGEEGSGQFTNIQQYVEANKAATEKLAGKLGERFKSKSGKIGQDIAARRQALLGAGSQYAQERERLGGGSETIRRSIAEAQRGEAPTQKEIQTYSQFAGGYDPKLLDPRFAQQQQNIQALEKTAKNLETRKGRFGELQNIARGGGYSRGERSLDRLLLSLSEPEALSAERLKQAPEAVKQQLGTLRTDIAAQREGFGTERERLQQEAQAQLLGKQGAIPKFEQDIQSRVAAEKERVQRESETLRNLLSRGQDVGRDVFQSATGATDLDEFMGLYQQAQARSLEQKLGATGGLEGGALTDEDLRLMGIPEGDYDASRQAFEANKQMFSGYGPERTEFLYDGKLISEAEKDKLVQHAISVNDRSIVDRLKQRTAKDPLFEGPKYRQNILNQLRGQANQEDVQRVLGARTGQSLYDVGQFVDRPDLESISKAQVSTPEEFARSQALYSLAQQDPYLQQANLARAGTSRDIGAQLRYGEALQGLRSRFPGQVDYEAPTYTPSETPAGAPSALQNYPYMGAATTQSYGAPLAIAGLGKLTGIEPLTKAGLALDYAGGQVYRGVEKTLNLFDDSGIGSSVFKPVVETVAAPVKKIVKSVIKSFFCFVKGTKIKMKNGTFKNIEDLKLKDKVLLGGKVICKGEALSENDLYKYKDEYVTGGHAIFENGSWLRVKDSNHSKKLNNKEIVVYPIWTENHLLVTKNFISADFGEVDGEMTDEDSLKIINNDKDRNHWLMEEEMKLDDTDKTV